MFTGIVETLGIISDIKKDQENIHLTIQTNITNELKIDQSVAHNGVCLTVVNLFDDKHVVTAIKETIDKTTLGSWKIGDKVNIERAMKLGDRLDGHIVQGHVDQTAICKNIEDKEGSWVFTFEYDSTLNNITIEKRMFEHSAEAISDVIPGFEADKLEFGSYDKENYAVLFVDMRRSTQS